MDGSNHEGSKDQRTPMFSIRAHTRSGSARLGDFVLRGRQSIPTPNYIGITSRGAIPHVTQDIFADGKVAPGVYVALEDFIERAPKSVPPIFNYQSPDGGASPLRRFIALPDDTPLILGPRRVPPVVCPTHNTSSTLAIFTNVGFNSLSVTDYVDAAQKLRPDILIGLADISFGASTFSRKRTETMTDRTSRWMIEQADALAPPIESSTSGPAMFAPLLPVPTEAQSWYLDELVGRLKDDVNGLAVYDSASLIGLPQELQTLPRLCFTEPATPQKLLQEVSYGIDLFTVPFVSSATDAGIALDFTFPCSRRGKEFDQPILPLGTDMWLEEHEADLSPLSSNCGCYACTDHHRAYLRHLLVAKEMLGWVLLQLHNHRVLDSFFKGVRSSVEQGTFEEDRRAFEALYEPTLPAKTGQGPRVRGYQYKSEGPGEVRRNPAAFRSLNDARERIAESSESITPNTDLTDIEGSGLAHKIS